MSNSTSNLDLISSSQATKEVTANAMLDALSPASLFGRRATTTAALTWGYYGGNVLIDGVLTQIANGTILLTASLTNYIEASRTGVISTNTTSFTAGLIPLYSIVAGASTITSYTDYRMTNIPPTGRLSLSVAGAANVTLTQAQVLNQILEFTGALTASISVIVPLAVKEYRIFNNTTGAFTLTIIGATGTGTAIAQTKRAIIYSDGTNVVRLTADA
jgi:hypothetical protein